MLSKEDLLKQRLKVEGNAVIFFLFNDDEIVYIGKSSQSNLVLGQHFNTKKFNSFTIINVEEKDLDELLVRYICKFRPKYSNPALNTSGKYLSKSRITQQISGHLLNFILRHFDIDTINYNDRTIYKTEDLLQALKICGEHGIAVKSREDKKIQYNSSIASKLRGKLI